MPPAMGCRGWGPGEGGGDHGVQGWGLGLVMSHAYSNCQIKCCFQTNLNGLHNRKGLKQAHQLHAYLVCPLSVVVNSPQHSNGGGFGMSTQGGYVQCYSMWVGG